MFIESVTGKDFLSFEEINYVIPSEAVLVQGENKEQDDQESNGSGKSGYRAAIKFALTNVPPPDKTMKELIRNGQDCLEVATTIHCPIRKQKLKVERRVHSKRGGSSQLSIDGVVKYSFTDKMVKQINEFVTEWMAISKSALENFYIIDGESYASFITAPNSEKIEFISKFSNSQIIKGVWDIPKKEREELEKQLQKLNDGRISIEARKSLLATQLETEKSRDLKKEAKSLIEKKKAKYLENDREIVKAEIKIDKLKGEAILLNKSKEALGAALDDSNVILEGLKETDFSKDTKKLKKKREKQASKHSQMESTYQGGEMERDKIAKDLDRVTKILMGVVTCPKCNHKFKPEESDSGEDFSKIEKKKKKLKQQSKEVLKELLEIREISSGINKKIEKLDDSLGKIGIKKEEEQEKRIEIRSKIEGLKDDVVSYDRKLSRNKSDSANLEADIKSYKKKKKTLKTEMKDLVVDNSERIKEHEEGIKTEEKLLEKQLDKISKKSADISETKTWELDLKKFYAHLANKFIKVIQGYTNKNLQDMGSDLQMIWEGYKIKTDGELSEKITPYIIRNGETKPWGYFSKGERIKMEFACMLANQDINNASNPWGGLHFLYADEATDGLDALGTGFLMKSLMSKKIPIFVTTHVSDKDVHSNIMLIRKNKHGISKIVKS